VALRLDLACSAEYRVAGRNRIFCDGHHIGIVATCVSTLARRAGRLSDSPNPRAVLTYAEPGTCPPPDRGFLFRPPTSLVPARCSSRRWLAYTPLTWACSCRTFREGTSGAPMWFP